MTLRVEDRSAGLRELDGFERIADGVAVRVAVSASRGAIQILNGQIRLIRKFSMQRKLSVRTVQFALIQSALMQYREAGERPRRCAKDSWS